MQKTDSISKNKQNQLKSVKDEEQYADVGAFMVYLLQLGRVMFITPVSIQRIKSPHGDQLKLWRISYSSRWHTYSIVFGTIYTMTTLYGVGNQNSQKFYERAYFMKALKLIIYVNAASITIFAVLCVIKAKVHAESLVKAFNLMKKADLLLSWSNYKTSAGLKFPVFAVLIMVYSLSVMSTQIASKWQSYFNFLQNFEYAAFLALYYSFYFIGILMTIFTSSIIYMFKEKLDNVNENLKMLSSELKAPKWIYGKSGVIPLDNESKKQKKFDNSNIADNEIRYFLGSTDADDIGTKICKTLRARELLAEAANNLNDSFGFALLAIFITVIGHLVISMYLIISVIAYKKPVFSIAMNAVWCAAHLFKIILLIESCHIITKTAKETEIIVTKMLAAAPANNLKKELKFYIDLLKQKPMIFSCMDLRYIDRSIIADTAGAILTLLVVLIQYGL